MSTGARQLALLDTRMVELEEIFLTYIQQGDQTLYYAFREGNFRARRVVNEKCLFDADVCNWEM